MIFYIFVYKMGGNKMTKKLNFNLQKLIENLKLPKINYVLNVKSAAKELNAPDLNYSILGKEKNIYVVEVSKNKDEILFEECSHLPLRVKEKNGQELSDNIEWAPIIKFPNPGAYNLVQYYDLYAKKLGKRIAGTIIEYETKSGKKLYLFPDNSMVLEDSKSIISDKPALIRMTRNLFQKAASDCLTEIKFRNTYNKLLHHQR